MNIFYSVWAELPSKAAHSLHFMKQCQGLAANSFNVSLLFPQTDGNRNVPDADLYEYYNVNNSFNLVRIPVNKKMPGSKMLYCLSIANYVRSKNGVVFTRDTDIASICTYLKIKTILELHRPLTPGKHIWKYLQNKMLASKYLLSVVVISDALKELMLKDGVKKDLLIVAHDASDLPDDNAGTVTFDEPGKYTAEIGYVGHLYEGKGVEIVFKAAAGLPNARFHIVGGLDKDIASWKEKFSAQGLTNAVFHGFVVQKNISAYLNSFDICLLPNQRVVRIYGADEVNISDFTSPLKMFDYMAHGKAIIASDLPVLKEVLNTSNAMLCDPDNVAPWIDAITLLSENKAYREQLGSQALADFKAHYTWKKRAVQIMAKAIAK